MVGKTFPFDIFRFTYEIAPVFVLMEEEVLNNLAIHVGWHSHDGILSPGTPYYSISLKASVEIDNKFYR